jgi:hypothetical protein
LSSDTDYYNYKYQFDTIAAMSGIQDHQAHSSVCDDEGCYCEHQNGRHVSIFEEEAYKIFISLEDGSLQLGCEFSIFTAPYTCQPSQTAIEEAQKNIRGLRKMVGQLQMLLERINEFDIDQETKEAYKHIYTSVSEKYVSHIQRGKRLHATEGDPLTVPESSPTTSPI